MFFKKSVQIDSHIDTLVGHETQIQGNMHFAGGLRVDGQIAGNVIEKREHPSTLIISENGAITGTVEASKIVLNGLIRGPVKSSVFIELQSKARIVGDLYYKSLEMHTGAVIEGKLVYLGEQQAETVAPEAT
jgi:cytoskeletal protein CcmA (bactofilin family)